MNQDVGIAIVMGAYLCLSNLGFLRRKGGVAFLSNMAESPAALHAVGALAFLAGGGILAFHQAWDWPLGALVNVIALIWLIEGAGMLAQPGLLARIFADPEFATKLRISQWVQLALGILMLGLAATKAY